MIKGKMKLELTEIDSGVTEIVFEENMVTDALSEIFKPLGIVKSSARLLNTFAPYYQTLLGGLLLFDTPIEERADNIYPPATANLVGCGAYGAQNNTTGTLRGNYNQTESEFNINDRYMKYVYDFTTSQSNGQISSVCLTHVNGGYTSYGGKDAVFTSGFPLGVQVDDGTLQYVLTSCTGATTGDKQSGYTIGTTQLLFLIDRENDCAYYFRIDSIGRITIIKRKAWLKGVSLIDNPYKTKPLIEEKVINLTTNLLATSYISYNYDIDDNCLYLVSASSSTIAANKNFVVTKIEFGTWNLTQYTIANTTGVILASSGTRYAFTYKGYVLIRANASPYEIYKIELGNAANVIPIQMIGVSSVSGSFTHAINGRVYIDGYTASAGNWLYVVNLESNEIMKCETYRVNTTSNAICYTPVYNEPLLWFASIGTTSSIGFLMMTNYLATINNLENPVTKTSEKTMKLTYIIQEE